MGEKQMWLPRHVFFFFFSNRLLKKTETRQEKKRAISTSFFPFDTLPRCLIFVLLSQNKYLFLFHLFGLGEKLSCKRKHAYKHDARRSLRPFSLFFFSRVPSIYTFVLSLLYLFVCLFACETHKTVLFLCFFFFLAFSFLFHSHNLVL